MHRTVIIHYHIFKNAGTTVDWALQRFFRDGHVAYEGKHARSMLVANEIKRFLRRHPSVQVLTSHHARFPVPRVAEWKLIPIVFVRHPIDRAASVYSFEKRQDAQSAGARNAKIMSMQEYFRWRLSPPGLGVIANGQVRALSGAPVSVPGKLFRTVYSRLIGRYKAHRQQARGMTSPGKEAMSRAVKNLESCSVVGIVERFEESMVYLEHVLRRSFPEIDLSFKAQNVTQGRRATLQERVAEFEKELGDEDLIKSLYEWNELDLELHRFANDELDRRIRAVNGFDALVRDFRQRQTRLTVER